ncbi:hypothetical protein R3W88_009616 [Solanum pinnatisectum]|uniref:CASP-like protein n=1 Tax=Solanum pinnatisectum TaxID=50273 RepID=A0AAV9MBE5_9SOLN|nr:hypothetical protein R3W88_009616 [Solanum pinnatisectum]
MGVVSKAGDWAFKAFSAGLGVATIFFAATFSANVYRGLSWHNRQSSLCSFLFCSACCLLTLFIGLRRKDLKSCSSKNDGLRSPALPHRVAS